MTLHPEIIHENGTTKTKIIARDDGGNVVDAEIVTIESGASRQRFVKRLAEKTGEDAEQLNQKILSLLNIPDIDSVDGSDGDDDGGDGSAVRAERIAQSTLLVELAKEDEFFHADDLAFAYVNIDGHRENHAVNGKAYRLLLQRRFYVSYKKAASAQALQDALGVLGGKALFEGEGHSVHVRIGRAGGNIYLDLANDGWEAVEISPTGWRVVSDPPIKFIRKRGVLPLPTPEPGGNLAELRPLINAGDEPTWILLMAWLGSVFSAGPFPALALNGEQGSGKSTLCRMLRMLVDPNLANLRVAPKDDRDLIIAASNSMIVAFDNLSAVPPSLSDGLCRLATGGGFSTRELYSDDNEKIFDAMRPILLNGIEELASRPDLLERSITISLPSIPDDGRVDEEMLWKQFHEARPRILGAVLDAVSMALRNLSSVRLARLPRMADFARWVVAAEPGLPWKAGDFLKAYDGNRAEANNLALEASPIAPGIQKLVGSEITWNGTASDLLKKLDALIDESSRRRPDWPKTPRALSGGLKRIIPALRKIGIEVTIGQRLGHERRRTIYIEQAGKTPSAQAAPSADGDSASKTLFSPKNADGTRTVADGTRTVADDAENSYRPQDSHENRVGASKNAGAADAADADDKTPFCSDSEVEVEL